MIDIVFTDQVRRFDLSEETESIASEVENTIQGNTTDQHTNNSKTVTKPERIPYIWTSVSRLKDTEILPPPVYLPQNLENKRLNIDLNVLDISTISQPISSLELHMVVWAEGSGISRDAFKNLADILPREVQQLEDDSESNLDNYQQFKMTNNLSSLKKKLRGQIQMLPIHYRQIPVISTQMPTLLTTDQIRVALKPRRISL